MVIDIGWIIGSVVSVSGDNDVYSEWVGEKWGKFIFFFIFIRKLLLIKFIFIKRVFSVGFWMGINDCN